MGQVEYTGTVVTNLLDAFDLETRIYDKELILERSGCRDKLYTDPDIRRNPLDTAHGIAYALHDFPIVLEGERTGTYKMRVDRIFTLPCDFIYNYWGFERDFSDEEVFRRLIVMTAEEAIQIARNITEARENFSLNKILSAAKTPLNGELRI